MKRVGLIGWRGMVGSVLMQRMLEEQDFDLIEPVFFTTSNVGGQGPSVGKDIAPLKDAYSIEELKTLDVILTCQGGDYTSEVFPKLREAGWHLFFQAELAGTKALHQQIVGSVSRIQDQ